MNEIVSPRLIAIVGGSGSGKSWLADRLQELIGSRVARLSLDDFYLDRSHLSARQREKLNFDNPRAIDWQLVEEVLESCHSGVSVRVPRYDFKTPTRSRESFVWQRRPLVLMDGLWLLYRPTVRRLFDLSIFLNCSETLRFRRRLARDLSDRGRNPASVRRQFVSTVAPMHKRYVQPQARWADIVLKQSYHAADVQQLAVQIGNLSPAGPSVSPQLREPIPPVLPGSINPSIDYA